MLAWLLQGTLVTKKGQFQEYKSMTPAEQAIIVAVFNTVSLYLCYFSTSYIMAVFRHDTQEAYLPNARAMLATFT